jgi:hypothetical protein
MGVSLPASSSAPCLHFHGRGVYLQELVFRPGSQSVSRADSSSQKHNMTPPLLVRGKRGHPVPGTWKGGLGPLLRRLGPPQFSQLEQLSPISSLPTSPNSIIRSGMENLAEEPMKTSGEDGMLLVAIRSSLRRTWRLLGDTNGFHTKSVHAGDQRKL